MFIRDYLTYATGNEAPEMFHVWGAYTCLAAAVSRRVWLPFEDYAIFPNLYTMYVGGAGNGKSIALQKVKRVLAEVGDVPISGSIETAQGLWRHMAGNPNADPPVASPVKFQAKWPDGLIRDCHPMTIIANEFINFISLDAAGWIQSLCDIYDEDVFHYRTKNMGEDKIIGPYIVLLGALTTDVAADLTKQKILSTGLARRTIFQYGERRWLDPHAMPEQTPEQLAARGRAVAHLRTLKKCHGKFSWTPENQEWWKAWYDKQLAEVPKKPPQTQSWFASKATQVLKLSMLTSLAERADLVMTTKHFELVLSFLEELEKDLYRIFGGVGRNELASVAAKMLAYLTNLNAPISKQRLHANFFGDCKSLVEFEDCLQHLLETKSIKMYSAQIGDKVGTIVGLPGVIEPYLRSLPGASLPSVSEFYD